MMRKRNFYSHCMLTVFIVGFLLFFNTPVIICNFQASAWAANSGWSGDVFADSPKTRAVGKQSKSSGGSTWNGVIIEDRSGSADAFSQPVIESGGGDRDESFVEDFRPGFNRSETSPNSAPAKAKTVKPAAQTDSSPKPKLKPKPKIEVDQRKVPLVKFSATDPCAAAAQADSCMPWESVSTDDKPDDKLELPDDVDVVLPPPLPDLKTLSKASYNAAVSVGFEGMRLIYGPLSESDTKKFEAAWAPLFDYPTREIIDYLNKLNPLVSQFLSCREAYLRNLNDIQLLLYDACFAVEMDDRQAWEAAMAEAGVYKSAITPLESALKILARKITALGNPPDPTAAKCKQRRRYEKALGTPPGLEGCWVGFVPCGSFKDPEFQYNFKVRVNGDERIYGIRGWAHVVSGKVTEIGCPSGLCNDRVTDEKITGEDWSLYKFTYPDIPEIPETSDSHYQKLIAKLKRELADAEDDFKRFDLKLTILDLLRFIEEKKWSRIFYETALEWTAENKWSEFDYDTDDPDAYHGYLHWWKCPTEIRKAFKKALKKATKQEWSAGAPKPQPETEADNSGSGNDEQKLESNQAEQDRKDKIATHTEMIKVIQHKIDQEIAERDDVLKNLAQAKDQRAAEELRKRLKELNLRIIGFQSNLQAEKDLVTSYNTGNLVRTRQMFDEYARAKFIDDTRKKAVAIDGTRRIAARVDMQIELLPVEERPAARRLARKMLDRKTIASGDIEKARKLVNAFNKKIQGYADYDHAMAREAEIDSEENERMAQWGIMAVGTVAIGMGAAALAETYGAGSATAIYGPHLLGAVYGGTTGLVAGGPKEGLVGAVSWCSPKGFTVMQFLEGYENAGCQEDAAVSDKVWAGVKQAGVAYILGKTIEAGVGWVTKGSLILFGEESRLFKPVTGSPMVRARKMTDAMRASQKYADAEKAIKEMHGLEVKLAFLKNKPAPDPQEIAAVEKVLEQTAAELNISFYSKWILKYKTPPGIRRRIDARIQQNYIKIGPEIKLRLEEQGYDMSDIEFRQFRNSTSAGSSSMDLDWVPILKSTGQEPGIRMFTRKMVLKRDGTMVPLKQFMGDAQAAMEHVYFKEFGLNARMSDMNMVTSVHPEAFSTPKLLDKNVDFSTLTSEEIASVGKVLKVKMDGISRNKMLPNVTKMQAKCRESAKEIENMLLKKLRQDLRKAPANSPQQKRIQDDIHYWEEMLCRFKKIGMEETDPLEIIRLNREVIHETGGKEVTDVINDLMKMF